MSEPRRGGLLEPVLIAIGVGLGLRFLAGLVRDDLARLWERLGAFRATGDLELRTWLPSAQRALLDGDASAVDWLWGGVLGTVLVARLLHARAAGPWLRPLGVFVAGCAAAAIAAILLPWLRPDEPWTSPGRLPRLTLLGLALALVASLWLAARPPCRSRSPRRATALALAGALLLGAPVAVRVVDDHWPRRYPPFQLELVPMRDLREHDALRAGEEAWSPGPLDAETGAGAGFALDRAHALTIASGQVRRLSWQDDPPAVRFVVDRQVGAALHDLTSARLHGYLGVFLDGRLLMAPIVRSPIGATFLIEAGQDPADTRALYERLTGEPAPR